jgi:23S rRNA (adenine2503-C2)-methyltransferase
MQKKVTALKGLTLQELQDHFTTIGEAKYRARQVFNWMYNHRVTDFEEMSNLPISLRRKLREEFSLMTLDVAKKAVSSDGATVKFLFRTSQNHVIESVIIPDEERTTLCVSTQVGCPLDCKFCATGLMGYKQNLSAGEIFDQYLLANANHEKPVTNIVYMGMGEPLLNYDATVKSLSIFSEEMTKGVSLKKITVSTSGIPKRIKDLADTGLKVKLAFSLHSCFEDIRSRIMPINDKYSLKSSLEAVHYFLEKTGGRVTYEYVMLAGVNDRKEDEEALVRLCRRMPAKVNLIPFNSLAHMNPGGISGELKPTSHTKLEAFANRLRDQNITVIVRNTKGQDIAAACGQLAVTEQSA